MRQFCEIIKKFFFIDIVDIKLDKKLFNRAKNGESVIKLNHLQLTIFFSSKVKVKNWKIQYR